MRSDLRWIINLWRNSEKPRSIRRKVIKLDTILKTRNLIDFSLRLFSQRSSCPKYVPLCICSAWFVVVRSRVLCLLALGKLICIQFVHGLWLVHKIVLIRKNVRVNSILFPDDIGSRPQVSFIIKFCVGSKLIQYDRGQHFLRFCYQGRKYF